MTLHPLSEFIPSPHASSVDNQSQDLPRIPSSTPSDPVALIGIPNASGPSARQGIDGIFSFRIFERIAKAAIGLPFPVRVPCFPCNRDLPVCQVLTPQDGALIRVPLARALHGAYCVGIPGSPFAAEQAGST